MSAPTQTEQLFVVSFTFTEPKGAVMVFSFPVGRHVADLIAGAAGERRRAGLAIDNIAVEGLHAQSSPDALRRQLERIPAHQTFEETIAGQAVRFVCSPITGRPTAEPTETVCDEATPAAEGQRDDGSLAPELPLCAVSPPPASEAVREQAGQEPGARCQSAAPHGCWTLFVYLGQLWEQVLEQLVGRPEDAPVKEG